MHSTSRGNSQDKINAGVHTGGTITVNNANLTATGGNSGGSKNYGLNTYTALNGVKKVRIESGTVTANGGTNSFALYQSATAYYKTQLELPNGSNILRAGNDESSAASVNATEANGKKYIHVEVNPLVGTVSSVSLNKKAIALYAAETETLTATVDPNDAVKKTWLGRVMTKALLL